MNLRQMEVFRAIMLTGGVRGAAELLHVSQPAISKVLSQAQRQTGFALFERVKGRLVPTPEGQQLHQEIDVLWRGVERVRDVSRSLAAPRTGTLRLGVSASFAPYLVPRTIALLYERFPQLKSHMEILFAPIMVEALLDSTVDLGVALQPNEHPNLEPVQARRCAFACVMPVGHPLARLEVVRPADLRGERVITSDPNTPYGQALQRAFGKEAAGWSLTWWCCHPPRPAGTHRLARVWRWWTVRRSRARGFAAWLCARSRAASAWRSASCATATGPCWPSRGHSARCLTGFGKTPWAKIEMSHARWNQPTWLPGCGRYPRG